MAEDKPLPVELPAPALKEAQHRVLRVQAANDRFGAPVSTRQTNPGMTHFHPLSRFGWRRSMAGMGHQRSLATTPRNKPDYHVEEPGPTGTLGAAKKRWCVKQLTLDSGIGDLSRAPC
jgi:hypothetical protein